MIIRLLFALVLLTPLSASSQEITAIGFVEDHIRLAFVRTKNGWEPSCFFQGQDRAKLLSDGSLCASKIMAKSWQVFDSKKGTINIGPLVPIKHKYNYSSNAGLVGFALPRGAILEFDQSAKPRYTWTGKHPPPLLALPTGTKVTVISNQTLQPPEKDVKDELFNQYLDENRIHYTCEQEPEYKVHKRPAAPTDVQVIPLLEFSNSVRFYEVSMKIDDASQCEILDNEVELMAVKEGGVFNLTKPFRKYGGAFKTSLTLFNGYQISTESTVDTVFIAFVGGYNRDGYALIDADLSIRSVSMWGYH